MKNSTMFLPVTDRYGYTYEKYNDNWLYLVYRHTDGKRDAYPITSRGTRTDAVYQCRYLEALNYGGNKQ